MGSYRFATGLVAPLVPLWLFARQLRGKEDPARRKERLGIPSMSRPIGTLFWLHAASVGEANSVLTLVKKIRARFPAVAILLTTGTVTSAALMQARLPKEVIHQYAPVDTPQATLRFIRHWKPDLAFWVESEFWPNLIQAADYYQCFMGVINARLSDRSFQSWQKHPKLIKRMLGCFNVVFAQSDEDAKRLESLGAKDVICVGNLKYDATPLPCDEAELLRLKNAVGTMPVWLAASTHPGEEKIVAQAHKQLAVTRPDLLTVIVPRHPGRGAKIAGELKKYGRVAQRSKNEPIAPGVQFYIADTLGELGLFYRLCEIVFMGGSLVEHGGQNPLEPARLACGIVTGPHTANFDGIYRDLDAVRGCLRARDAKQLAAQVEKLMSYPDELDAMQTAAKHWIENQGGAAERILDMLAPILAPRKK